MKATQHKPASAATRRLALRMRPDLEIHLQHYGRERYWLVKDPLALSYFHLREEEYALLQMLDGRTSLDEMKRRFAEAFAPFQISFEQLQAFLARLHRCGLLLAEAPGQGQQLLELLARRRRRAWLERLSNVLAIRFPGIDPEPFLRWLYPGCRWLFSYWFLAGCLLLGCVAALLAAAKFQILQSKLPDFSAFFTAGNVLWLVAALAVAKVLHELGHALTCQHFGGECHEIGVLLLVFAPCLYCNVSDAWLFPNKWQRIAVSAAGIVVEIALASIAGFLWWYSVPGVLNSLCLNMMFICSLNTLMINGNPLLRYDGYYALADFLEVPNLSQQSRALLHVGLARFLLGMRLPPDRSLPRSKRGLLAAYGVAAAAYRWFVVIVILWFCYRALKPYGLEPFAQTLVLLVLAGMVAVPVWSLAVSLSDPGYRRRVRPGRVALSCGSLAVIVLGLLWLPLPLRISAPAVLEPRAAHYVYVVVPGSLVQSASVGEEVDKGQELARLCNLDVRKETVALTGQRDQQRLQLQNLRLRLAEDPSVAVEIPAAEEMLSDVEKRLKQRQRDEENLVLRAPAAGIVLPPPRQAGRPYAPGQLAAGQGSPLEARNLGSYLETGTLFCLVGHPAPLEALLVIDQSDIKFVRSGQRVRMQLDELPGKALGGTVTELAKTDLKVAPRELAKGSNLPVRVDEKGLPRPLVTSYQARAQLDEHTDALLLGTRGQAKIFADPQSLGYRLYRYLKRTFNFAI